MNESIERNNESSIEATAVTTNFQDEVRQWFTAMSSEERAAALACEDDGPLMALLGRVAPAFSPSSTTTISSRNNSRREQRSSNNVVTIKQPAPTSSGDEDETPTDSAKRATDKLFSNGT